MTDTRDWWPEEFEGDFPAFRVKRRTYGESEGGDYVRGSTVELPSLDDPNVGSGVVMTLPHTAIKFPTSSLSIAGLAPAMKGRLFVKASDLDETHLYNSMAIQWNWPAAIEDTFKEMAIVRSAFGAPCHPQQGQTVFRAKREFFPVDADGLLIAPEAIYDRNLMPGHWYYYTAFFRTNPIDWTPLMSDSAALPGKYHHAEHLWNTIPPYYQFIDENQGRQFLKFFLDILGYELDRTRQMVESLLNLHRIDDVPMALLRGLGANYGYKYEAGLGDVNYRGMMANISRLLTKRGTAAGLLGIVETCSKYDCDQTPGTNSVLLPDTSNFVTSIGQWKPAHPDLSYTTPAVADYLLWDKPVLRLKPRLAGQTTGPPVPGAIGSMIIDSLNTDEEDIFITAGAGKRKELVFGATGLEEVITESIPLHDGIPVHANEQYGMSLWIKMVVPSEVILYFLPFNRLGKLTDDLPPIPSLVEVPPDSDWFQVVHTGKMPPKTTYLVPAIYFRDRPMAGGLGGRTPEIQIGAVMVYHIISEVPTALTAPDRYLVLGVSYMEMGETTTDDGTGAEYEGFVIGAPVTGDQLYGTEEE